MGGTLIKRTRSRSLTEPQNERLPSYSISQNGMRLGTPVAQEAAKSFWSMDMLKTSLNRMAFYANCEGNSSQGSIASNADSGFQSSVPSARSTPTVSQLPQITTSAPSSPHSQTRKTPTNSVEAADMPTGALLHQPLLCPVSDSPLLVARRERETARSPIFTNNSSTPSNRSSASLTSSSKTISPSLSAQILLPARQRHHCRSLSAEQRHRSPLPSSAARSRRKLKCALSDGSIHHLKQDPSFLTELHRTLNYI